MLDEMLGGEAVTVTEPGGPYVGAEAALLAGAVEMRVVVACAGVEMVLDTVVVLADTSE